MKSLFYSIGLIIVAIEFFREKKFIFKALVILALLSFGGLWYFDYTETREAENKIVSASATANFTLKFSEDRFNQEGSWKSYTEGNQAYIAFGYVGNEIPVFVIRSRYIIAEKIEKNRISVTEQFDLLAPDSQVNGGLEDVNRSDLIHVRIPGIPYIGEAFIEEGRIELTFNGDEKITLIVPTQEVSGDLVKIPR